MSNKSQGFVDLVAPCIYDILCFVAMPIERSHVLCFIFSLLSRDINSRVEADDELWSHVLTEYTTPDATHVPSSRNSKRLRKTVKDRVSREHGALCERTAHSHYLLTEMVHSSESALSLSRLRSLFPRRGPSLRVNQRANVGGTFLVEVCRARFVEEKVILRCVKELIEVYGAHPDVSSGAGPGPQGVGGLTPLCIAAARGMVTVVKYLIGPGVNASKDLKGEGRFRLFGDQRRSVSGSFTPLMWSEAMLDAELKTGLSDDDLLPLRRCVRILG
jgi:hypothetical protein